MIYTDRIHGVVNAPEPVFAEIIASPTFQRLHRINMGPWRPNAPFYSVPVTRFDHSVGVFMLLRKHGAGLPEQIAGLIHDVSHTAFSHLSDRIFGTTEDVKASTYQDDVHTEFVKKSDLSRIITRNGFDLDEILDEEPFVLKERELPDLCADRIDYGLRAIAHMQQYGLLMDCDEYSLTDKFVATPHGFVMTDFESARMFARAFNETDEKIYASYNGVFYEEMLARICRDAIARKIVSRDDFYHMTDMQILRKMHMAGLDFGPLYKNPADYYGANGDPDTQIQPQKLRRIDPPYITERGTIKRLSDTDPAHRKYMSSCPKYIEYRIKNMHEQSR
ncbi:HD domain-containing protein [bacterium]|nr:HD domain-containing protein [bacterium]